MENISVLLVSECSVVRGDCKSYLSFSDKISSICEVDSVEKAYQKYRQQSVDVVVLDLSIHGLGGMACISQLISRDALCKVLVLNTHKEMVYAARVIKSGAKGYITRDSIQEALVTAICSIVQGQAYVDAEIAQQFVVNMVAEKIVD